MTNRIKEKLNNSFTILPNELFDGSLSAKAVGIFAYLCSKDDDWQFYQSEIEEHFVMGRSAVASAIKELIEAGLLFKYQPRDGTKFLPYEWIIYPTEEDKNVSKPASRKPASRKPARRKPATNNKDSNNKDSNNKDSNNKEEKFTFNLPKTTTIDKISPEYKNRLKHEIEAFYVELENRALELNVPLPPIMGYEDFILKLESQGYKYKNFWATYQTWHRTNTAKWSEKNANRKTA